jgi:hypothetical protein
VHQSGGQYLMAEVGERHDLLERCVADWIARQGLLPGAGEPKKKPPRVDREEALTKK